MTRLYDYDDPKRHLPSSLRQGRRGGLGLVAPEIFGLDFITGKPLPTGMRPECANPGVDPDIFFNKIEKLAALRICRRCKMREICLNMALSDPDTRGIWAGTDELQRKRTQKEAA